MPADAYSASLKGLSVNLLVKDVEDSVAFARQVLGATVHYSDVDFAALESCGTAWCVHADHTYDHHPLCAIANARDGRGAGVEIRLHGIDPDTAEAKAHELGYTVLSGAVDKPHGLREVYLLDGDGYCWVPDVPL